MLSRARWADGSPRWFKYVTTPSTAGGRTVGVRDRADLEGGPLPHWGRAMGGGQVRPPSTFRQLQLDESPCERAARPSYVPSG